MAEPVNPAYPTSGRYPGNNPVSRQEVYDYLMTKPGMTDVKANAIMANIEGESGFYSDAIQTGNVDNRGIGLFQHTFSSRKEGLVEEVPDWETNWKGQIDYAMGEPEMRNFMRKDYDSQEEATEAFMMKFENPAITSEKYPGKTLIRRGNKYYYVEGGKKIKIPKKDYEDAVRQKAEGRLEIYENTEYRQNVIARSNITQEDYENYYEGAESVTIDGDEVVVDFGDGNIIREPISKVDDAINAERQIESEGGTVGVSDQTESGQQNPPVIPPVTGPGIEGDTQVVTNTNEDDGEPSGLSNEQATPQDVEESDYVVDQTEAERVFGPTARLQNINGKNVILYTDNEGVEQQVDADTVTQQTPDYVTPSPVPPPAPPIVPEVQEEVPDATRTPEIPEVELQEDSEREIAETEEELRRRTMERQQELEEETQVEETEEVVEEVEEEVVDEVEVEEVEVGVAEVEEETEEVVEEQVSSSSLSLEEVQEIYGPNATIGNVNGEEVILITGAAEDGSEDEEIIMSDAIAQRDARIAAENEQIEQNNADALGMRRRDFRNMTEEELNQRLEETNLSDEEKDNIRTNWTSANEDSILENLFNSFTKGDGNALEKASKLLKASGGISSLVAGFVGAKAAKKGMETVEVPEIEGLSTAFKQYSQQQKALSETGLSYAETQTIKQGIDEAYKLGIDNLVRGTGGDRAKFLAGTGALDSNRQTSLLKLAALEDEARRQNREAYGKVLSFEANYNKEKDIFTKSREYNQKLADKAMFQNTASSAFQHVFDNIRFGQDYAPILDQMQKTVNQLGNVSNLLGSFNIETNNDTEQDDPNDPNE